jgi:hypothetical protein
MFKNVASQKVRLFAYDYTTGQPKTGDAANITAYVSKDHGSVTVLGDTSATEADATNAPGSYLFDLTQAETNADNLAFSAKSSTSNIRIAPIDNMQTFPASFGAFVTPTNLTAAQIATGVWQDATAGDFTAANSVGKSVMNGVALGTGLTVNALSTTERAAIADAVLDRDMSTGTDSGSTTVRTARQALRAIRNKMAVSAGTLTVYKEDDSTTSWSAAVTTDVGAEPIIGVDPAGP